ncbi:hypothetical protein SDC9_77110 [bioreactor metagenome]|uniref:Uncharacterized protein n=1 Tax=bioreactor metagenome TaxID=1076179 RepID=A0A644YQ17_9ZZZZ
MLVVMDNRKVKLFPQSCLDFKTSGCTDIFKVNTSKNRSQVFYCFYNLFGILSVQANRESVYACKFLEDQSFSFHDGQSRVRTYVPKSEYR